jgi:hypothetical protein
MLGLGVAWPDGLAEHPPTNSIATTAAIAPHVADLGAIPPPPGSPEALQGVGEARILPRTLGRFYRFT